MTASTEAEGNRTDILQLFANMMAVGTFWERRRKIIIPTSVSSLPAIVYRKISQDVKLTAMHLHEHQLLSLENILACVGFSESTFWRILKLWCETGDVVSISNRIRRRPRILQCDDVLYLIRLVRHRPEWFLDELLVLLDTNHFRSVHYAPFTVNSNVLASPSKSLSSLSSP
jgi:hypothetical protein